MLEYKTYYDLTKSSGGGGEGGTTDYNDLSNKPKINNITLSGNKTLEQLGVASKTELDEVRDIAEGAMKAVAFDDYEELVSTLNNTEATEYKVGENFLVRTLNVPDLWVYEVEQTSQPYTYTTDEQFISDLRTTGAIIVGHYVLSELETGKVDLENYVERSELDGYAKLTDLENPFWVTYGTTTYAEITEAVDAGRPVLCKTTDRVYMYGYSSTVYHYLMSTSAGAILYIRVNTSNNWSSATANLQATANRIDSTSTTAPSDTTYYSALATDNLIQGVEVKDTASTEATLSIEPAKNYVFDQPLTSLTISSVVSSYLESTLIFTAGDTITVNLPNTLGKVGEQTFEANKRYVLCFWNNCMVAGELN